jgi:hypothetical protein
MTWKTLNEIQQRLLELRHMAGISVETAMELDGEADAHFTIRRELGERLAFVVVDVERRVDDLLALIKDVDGMGAPCA